MFHQRISTVILVFLVLLFGAFWGCGNDNDTHNGNSSDDDDTGDDDNDNDNDNNSDDDDDDLIPTDLLHPEDIEYEGAFLLPLGGERPRTFAYGGNAMTYRPDGDSNGSLDGYPGSLFIMGHDRLAWGELPDGGMVAEISIPLPEIADNPADLPRAALLQDFHDVTGGLFDGQDEITHTGLIYLDTEYTGPKIHLAWGVHFQPEGVPSHAMFDPDLTDPQTRGAWLIGDASPYSVNGYMLEIPEPWADVYADSRVVGTGQFRDGGWSGKGPSLYAYTPWIDQAGTPAPPGTSLESVEILHYESSEINEHIRSNTIDDYQCADQWEGAAWIEKGEKSALIFAGTKGTGEKFWYGFVHPDGPEFPCVEVELVEQFTTCWTAAGEPCPASDLLGCDEPASYRGWWSSRFEAQMIFYDPAELAEVATGAIPAHQPQPYAYLNLDPYLFLTEGVEPQMLGTGVQRMGRIGSLAYDRQNQRIYLLELFAEEAAPIVHVFAIR